jgi:hypothetical protein
LRFNHAGSFREYTQRRRENRALRGARQNSVAERGCEWHEVGARIAQLALVAIWALLGVEILARHAKHVVTLYANAM